MAKATNEFGALQELIKCRIETPFGMVRLKILPEISDSKSANYSTEPVQGRSTPVINYAYSEPRIIQMDLNFMVTECQDIIDNLTYLRIIQSLVYPGGSNGGAPYTPPPVSKIICGKLLGDTGLCVVLRNYSVRYPTDVAWDVETYLPYRFTISCQWEVVYACSDLPTNAIIRTLVPNWVCPPPSIDAPL